MFFIIDLPSHNATLSSVLDQSGLQPLYSFSTKIILLIRELFSTIELSAYNGIFQYPNFLLIRKIAAFPAKKSFSTIDLPSQKKKSFFSLILIVVS